MGDLLRIDLTTRTTSEETVPPELIKELIGAKGIGTHYLFQEVGARGRAAESGEQAHLRRRPHGRHDDARQQPLRPVLRLSAHRRLRRVLLGRQPHAAVRPHGLQGRHRRGQGRRATSTSRSAKRARRSTSAYDLWGWTPSRPRTRSSRAPSTRRPRPASSGRPARSWYASPASTTTTGTSSAAAARARCTASKNLKGIVWHGEKKVEVARPDDFKAVVRDLIERAARTTPAWPPTSAAAPSTWCAS